MALFWDPQGPPQRLAVGGPSGPDPIGFRLNAASERVRTLPHFVVGARHAGQVVVSVANPLREHVLEATELELRLLGTIRRVH